jgi:agmatine deiminase
MGAPTPRELGYRMPAEWERHEATWLSWPRRESISFPGRYQSVPGLWLAMVEALSAGELVHVNVTDGQQEAEVRALLARSSRVRSDRVFVHRIPTDEPWCRDHGPIFVVRASPDVAAGGAVPEHADADLADGAAADAAWEHADRAVASGRASEIAVVDWRYNAWGGKYPPFERDDAVPARVAELLGVPAFHPGIVMEGGSLDVNGRGTLLTTEACLLNPNRNPTLARADVERYLRDFLGVSTIVWLGEGIAGDDTDGHIDDLARFVAPSTVVTVVEDDPADANYRPLQDSLRRLRAMRDQDGRPLEVLTLPMPGVVALEGQRLPASYANFYIGNDVVLVPTFSHPNDAAALAILGRCFPSRRVLGIESTELVWGLGAFHCATQQQPAVTRPVFRAGG